MSEGNVYLILGNSGSGRRQILVDLIDSGLSADETAQVALADSETSLPEDEQLAARECTEILRYSKMSDVVAPSDEDILFFVAPGDSNPADSIEAFQTWLKRSRAELARIIAVIDCRLGAEEPSLEPWFDCLVHFADAVLLSRREGLSPKWPQDFVKKYEALHYPCLFEYIKKGKVGNPQRVLNPEARRMALMFDDIEAEYQMDIDPDNLPDEPIDLVAPVDEWLLRNDGGQRLKRLPDIREYLSER